MKTLRENAVVQMKGSDECVRKGDIGYVLRQDLERLHDTCVNFKHGKKGNISFVQCWVKSDDLVEV